MATNWGDNKDLLGLPQILATPSPGGPCTLKQETSVREGKKAIQDEAMPDRSCFVLSLRRRQPARMKTFCRSLCAFFFPRFCKPGQQD